MEIINRNIRVFLKVVETGSISEAAKELYISQPAVSKVISKLEEEFHTQLFIRNRRKGLLLTDSAKRILPFITRLTETEDELFRVMGEGHRVKVAAMPIITTAVLSKVLPIFRKIHPEVTVEIIEGGAEEINELVNDGKADIGISIAPFEGLESEFLFKDHMVAISANQKFALVDLNTTDEPLVLCSIGYEVVTKQLSDDYEEHLTNCIVVRNSETVISLVQNGNGIGVISQYVLSESDHGLNSCQMNPEISFEYGLVAKSFKKLPKYTKKLAELIKEQICMKAT